MRLYSKKVNSYNFNSCIYILYWIKYKSKRFKMLFNMRRARPVMIISFLILAFIFSCIIINYYVGFKMENLYINNSPYKLNHNVENTKRKGGDYYSNKIAPMDSHDIPFHMIITKTETETETITKTFIQQATSVLNSNLKLNSLGNYESDQNFKDIKSSLRLNNYQEAILKSKNNNDKTNKGNDFSTQITNENQAKGKDLNLHNDDSAKNNIIEQKRNTRRGILKFLISDYIREMSPRLDAQAYQEIVSSIALNKLEQIYEEKMRPIEIKDKSDSIYNEPSGKKIAILTPTEFIDAKGKSIGDFEKRVRENRDSYCKYHGYECIYFNVSNAPEYKRDPSWAKLPAIRQVFDNYSDVEWIWCLDADAVIMEPEYSLSHHLLSKAVLKERIMCDMEYMFWMAKFASQRSPRGIDVDLNLIDIIISNDFNGINAGSFFIRRSKFSDYLLSIWDDSLDPFFDETPLHEQYVFNSLLLSSAHIQRHTAIVPQRLINSYLNEPQTHLERFSKYKPGDFVVHLAGCQISNNVCRDRFNYLWENRKII